MTTVKIICYLVAGICFILGLKMLGKTRSARRGNWLSSLGMLAAIVGAFFAIGERYAVEHAPDATFHTWFWMFPGPAECLSRWSRRCSLAAYRWSGSRSG